jgi:hypothetical protein
MVQHLFYKHPKSWSFRSRAPHLEAVKEALQLLLLFPERLEDQVILCCPKQKIKRNIKTNSTISRALAYMGFLCTIRKALQHDVRANVGVDKCGSSLSGTFVTGNPTGGKPTGGKPNPMAPQPGQAGPNQPVQPAQLLTIEQGKLRQLSKLTCPSSNPHRESHNIWKGHDVGKRHYIGNKQYIRKEQYIGK